MVYSRSDPGDKFEIKSYDKVLASPISSSCPYKCTYKAKAPSRVASLYIGSIEKDFDVS